jgi:uncharacterized membrane protein
MLGLLLFVPLVIIAVSIPLILGMVPRNHWYGFRTPKTLSSDGVWYQANRIGGRYFVITGLIQLVAIAIVRLMYPARLTEVIASYGSVLITVPLLIAVLLWFVKIRHI